MSTAEQPTPAPTPEAATFPWPLFARYVYAAKFLCGDMKRAGTPARAEGPVEPGSYTTAINVHNPHGYVVAIKKKAILLYDDQHPEDALERPTPPVRRQCPAIRELGPDWGLEIDCRDIREVLLAPSPSEPGPPAPVFIKGWVVIETLSDSPIDVLAVYTVAPLASKGQQPVSMTMDRVPGTRALLPVF